MTDGLPGNVAHRRRRGVRAAIGRVTRLVALTGYDAATVRGEAPAAGFDPHVARPCTPDKLAEIPGSVAVAPQCAASPRTFRRPA